MKVYMYESLVAQLTLPRGLDLGHASSFYGLDPIGRTWKIRCLRLNCECRDERFRRIKRRRGRSKHAPKIGSPTFCGPPRVPPPVNFAMWWVETKPKWTGPHSSKRDWPLFDWVRRQAACSEQRIWSLSTIVFHNSIEEAFPSSIARRIRSLATEMAELKETYACVPSTERGRGILISGDPRTDSIAYCNGRAVVIRRLDAPMDVSIYGEHGYPTTVARFSPNGEWVASADVSGTVRIWGRYGDRALKNEFRVLSGRIDDLQWSPDGLRIVASGDGKGKSFVRAFMWAF